MSAECWDCGGWWHTRFDECFVIELEMELRWIKSKIIRRHMGSFMGFEMRDILESACRAAMPFCVHSTITATTGGV